MSDLSLFFAENAAAAATEEFAVSDRFKDKNGESVQWQLCAITEEHNGEIRKSATRVVKAKSGMQTQDVNTEEYLGKLVAACVVYPNLNDSGLQNSYGVKGADRLIRKMLLAGEFANLVQKINELNGFDKDINELADEVKN